jgi:hypothetical protein
MDERVSVNALDGTGSRECDLCFAVTSLRGRKCQHRTNALATGEEAVAHGFVDGRRLDCGSREEAVERGVNQFQTLAEILLKDHARGLCREKFCAGNRKPYSTKR